MEIELTREDRLHEEGIQPVEDDEVEEIGGNQNEWANVSKLQVNKIIKHGLSK